MDSDERYLLGCLWGLTGTAWQQLRKSRYAQIRRDHGRPAMKAAMQHAWEERLDVGDPNAWLATTAEEIAARA